MNTETCSNSSLRVQSSCKTKIKRISQTQLYLKKNITLYFYMFRFTLDHHHHQAFVQNL